MSGRVITLIVSAFLVSAGGAADAGSSQFGAAKDNTLYEPDGQEVSNGAGEHFFTGKTSKGKRRRGIISFDIPLNIPRGATITGARLTLHMSRSATGPQTISLYKVSRDWGEGASDAGGNEGQGIAAETGDATWLHAFHDTVAWTAQGGDFEADASAAALVDGIGDYGWGSTPAMVSDVQGWLDDPSSCFGWIIVGNESANKTTKRFDTRENAMAANRPVLSVDFDAAADIVLNGSFFSAGDSLTSSFKLNDDITQPFTAYAVIELPDGSMVNALTLDTPLKPVATNVQGLSAPFTYPLTSTTVPSGGAKGQYRIIAAFFDPGAPIGGREDAFLEAVGPFVIQ